MRLTIINQFYVPDISPTAHLACSLAEHRAALGDEVTVLTSSGAGYVGVESAGPAAAANLRVRRLWTGRLGKARLLARVSDYLTFFLMAASEFVALPRQDVVVTLTTPPYIALAGLLHKLLRRGPRLVLWNMDCYPDIAELAGVVRRGGLLSRALRGLNRFLFRRLDRLICLDAAMADLLTAQYGPVDDRLRVVIIPNWERLSLFPPDASEPPWEGFGRLGLEGRFVVLYLGNAGVGHAFETVFNAAELLRGEPVSFLFVGGGARWPEIRQAREERGLDNVVLHGYVSKEQSAAVMAGSSCALITLRVDARGLMSPSKLHSNLAMGLPIAYVGPKGTNVDDALHRFGCGVSLRNGDARGLADWVRDLRADGLRLADLRGRARAAFEEAYCDVRTLRQFDEVLEGLRPGGR